MKKIIYAIYLFGAVVASLTSYFLDPVTALVIVFVTPMVAITMAEMQGFIQFGYHEIEEEKDSALQEAVRKNLSPEEAAEKFGQAIVNEMDEQIKDVEMSLMEMKQAREDASNTVRGIKK
jgi:uncharacterized protein YlxW (UPF0749 family)